MGLQFNAGTEPLAFFLQKLNFLAGIEPKPGGAVQQYVPTTPGRSQL